MVLLIGEVQELRQKALKIELGPSTHLTIGNADTQTRYGSRLASTAEQPLALSTTWMTTVIRCVPMLALLFAGAAQQAAAQTSYASSSPQQTSTPRGDSVLAQSQLQPGDVIRLRIWREPDLSGEFPVDESGTAVFPKLGPTKVASITADSLRTMLVATYSQYLRDPAIEVTFLRRVTILGAVNHPGIYPVDPTMTVHDAFALAGGTIPTGSPKHFKLRRNGKEIDVDFSQDTPIGRTSIRSGDELYVPERSWFARNGIYVVGAVITATAIIVSTVIRY
jgi:protein involved in polysaccharide export with SLBB domain